MTGKIIQIQPNENDLTAFNVPYISNVNEIGPVVQVALLMY
jgi:hypothetical protein